MKILTAKVAGGRIDVLGELDEGATVAVVGPDSGQIELSAEQEQELKAALELVRKAISSTATKS